MRPPINAHFRKFWPSPNHLTSLRCWEESWPWAWYFYTLCADEGEMTPSMNIAYHEFLMILQLLYCVVSSEARNLLPNQQKCNSILCIHLVCFESQILSSSGSSLNSCQRAPWVWVCQEVRWPVRRRSKSQKLSDKSLTSMNTKLVWFCLTRDFLTSIHTLCWKIVGNKRIECRVFIVTRKTFPLFYKHPEIYFIHLAILTFL